MPKLKTSALYVASAALLLLPSLTSVRAQDAYPNLAPSTMNTIMSSHISNLSLQKVIDRQNGRGGKSKKGTHVRGTSIRGASQNGVQPLTSTTYQTSPTVTKKVINQYVAWSRTQSPQEAVTLQKLFAQHNPIQIWKNVVQSDGLRTGDASDSLAAYWVLNYLIANQKTASTRTQALAVRNQVKPILVNNPNFARLGSAGRQEMSEVWMVNFVVQQGAYGTALKRQNKALLQKMSAAAVTRFKNEMGLDLRKLSLTNRGFVPRS